jgi:type IV secretory pathway VirB3-like protein
MDERVRIMEDNTSTDAVYDLIERVEQQRKRLVLIVMVVSISSLLGVSVNALALMVFSHQKGSLDIISFNILLPVIMLIVSIVLAILAAKKLMALKRLNQRLSRIDELEETIYNEVLNAHMDPI